MDLLNAVDEAIPQPVRETDKPFLMPIEDVFTITGRGTVVTGRVERGILKPNEEVEIVGIKPKSMKTVCTGIEMFRKILDEARAAERSPRAASPRSSSSEESGRPPRPARFHNAVRSTA